MENKQNVSRIHASDGNVILAIFTMAFSFMFGYLGGTVAKTPEAQTVPPEEKKFLCERLPSEGMPVRSCLPAEFTFKGEERRPRCYSTCFSTEIAQCFFTSRSRQEIERSGGYLGPELDWSLVDSTQHCFPTMEECNSFKGSYAASESGATVDTSCISIPAREALTRFY